MKPWRHTKKALNEKQEVLKKNKKNNRLVEGSINEFIVTDAPCFDKVAFNLNDWHIYF